MHSNTKQFYISDTVSESEDDKADLIIKKFEQLAYRLDIAKQILRENGLLKEFEMMLGRYK
jgi:hypothetical protein